jgi:hypothetical protein
LIVNPRAAAGKRNNETKVIKKAAAGKRLIQLAGFPAGQKGISL